MIFSPTSIVEAREKRNSMRKTPLQESLAFNISRTSTLLRRHLVRTLSDYNITPEQWQIIVMLWQSDNPISQKEITAALLKDKHTISRMIKNLEANGWVEKRSKKEDSRITLIQLTKKGLDTVEEMYQKLATSVRTKVFNHFSKTEKDQVKRFMKRLGDILETIQ
jgi:DNA-binding MarR family transcriptional regulator